MTALIVIAAVLALLAVVAFLRVRVTAGFAQYPFLYYRIGPITIPLVDKDWISEDLTDHTKRDKWQEKRRRQLENEKKKKKGPEVPAYSGKDLKKMAVVIRDLVAGVLRYVRKYACLETLRIRLLAASDDAMKTGVFTARCRPCSRPYGRFWTRSRKSGSRKKESVWRRNAIFLPTGSKQTRKSALR
ncbi:MAG: hypothetical protein II715_00590 [Clostridia bacterium]|nr:hypothetical protein [Clostridia bacterium]